MTSSPQATDDGRREPSGRALLGLFALAWIPRLALALVFLDLPLFLDDMYQYDMLGLSLSRGEGYRWYQRDYVTQLQAYFEHYYQADLSPDEVPENGYVSLFRPPGYPAFLAGVYLVAGEARRIAVTRVLQTILGAALAPGTYLLARRLRLRHRPALLAGGAVALYPLLWAYPIGLASENLFLFLTLGAVLMLQRAVQRRTWTSAALAGAAMGAAALTRGMWSIALVLTAVWLARQAGWRRAAVFAAVAFVLILPWAIRNSRIAGRPAFIENSIGYNLFVGYHPEGNGGFATGPALIPTRFLDDAERDRWSLEQAVGFIRSDPGRALSLLPRRLAYLAGPESRELIFFYTNNVFGPIPAGELALVLLWIVAPWVLIAACAPFGMAAAEDRAGRDLILMLVVATVVAYVPILAEPRFHLPLVPVLAPFAALVWWSPRQALRQGIVGRRAFLLASLVLAILVALWAWDLLRQAPQWAAILSAGGNTLRLTY